ELLVLLDVVELHELDELGEVHFLVKLLHLRLELEVGEFLAAQIGGHVDEGLQPRGDGRLDAVGEGVAPPEGLDAAEGNERTEDGLRELAAGGAHDRLRVMDCKQAYHRPGRLTTVFLSSGQAGFSYQMGRWSLFVRVKVAIRITTIPLNIGWYPSRWATV